MSGGNSIQDLPNELVLMVSVYLSAAELYSLAVTSRRFSPLLLPCLRAVASEPCNARFALYWAVLTKNRAFAEYLLKKGDGFTVMTVDPEVDCNPYVEYFRPVGQDGTRSVIEDSEVDWIMDQGLNLFLLYDKSDNYMYYSHPSRIWKRDHGYRPFHHAIKTGHHALLRLVLENLPPLDPDYSVRALRPAILFGTREMANIILTHAKTTFGEDVFKSALNQALFVAVKHCRENRKDEAWLRFLLSLGADANSRLAPSHKPSLQDRTAGGIDSLVDEHPYCFGKYGDTGFPIIHAAVVYSAPKVIRLLIKNGADIHAKDSQGKTALHLVGVRKRPQVSGLLLSNGIDINCKSNNGRTPLHMVVDHRNAVMTKFLLDKGADVNLQDNSGVSALHLACDVNSSGDTSWRRGLNRAEANLRIAKILLSGGADVQMRDADESTALHYAGVRMGTRGWNTSWMLYRYHFPTWQTAVINFLKRKGADPEAVNKSGATALGWVEDDKRKFQY